MSEDKFQLYMEVLSDKEKTSLFFGVRGKERTQKFGKLEDVNFDHLVPVDPYLENAINNFSMGGIYPIFLKSK